MVLKLMDNIAIGLWMGGIHFNVLALVVELFYLPHPGAVAALLMHLALTVFPVVEEEPPAWGKRLAAWIVCAAQRSFPATVQFEDEAAFSPTRPYLIGLEPHSVLPLSLIHFGEGSGLLPGHLGQEGRKMAFASSIVFYVPLVRHLWSWLGLRPASRECMAKFLKEGRVCILVPGGVQECLHMEQEAETLFLRKRVGFVKLAPSCPPSPSAKATPSAGAGRVLRLCPQAWCPACRASSASAPSCSGGAGEGRCRFSSPSTSSSGGRSKSRT
eukprot:CAMPEP_0114312114 /NCGR_PEP_ID=MMETSP0059-20121206/20230_1 /TAXON_ID=36894 /ORGANISM="Pyramimonas parkeae, Strain CCMP726" /LENGTH=270 /DNA_ID=CAMNT_0001436423 /DNA_START=213 /DNA_END=1025 /DNA_ORIENTATION=-